MKRETRMQNIVIKKLQKLDYTVENLKRTKTLIKEGCKVQPLPLK